MRISTRTLATCLLLAALALAMAACEDTDVTAPEGSTMTLIATPGAVLIDQDRGETEGSTLLVAQVVDAGGLPVDGVPIFFSTDGGLLGTVDNQCLPTNQCSLSTDACAVDGDCPAVTPQVLRTNSDGVVSDILTLRLFGDPSSVTVTAHGTTLSASATVSKTVNVGPADPVANISVSPANGQRSGLPFALDGTGSTFDPQVEPTCYEWLITEETGATQIIRGPLASVVPGLVIGDRDDPNDEQDITIQLRVSDEPTILCSTNPSIPADDNDFSFQADVVSYQIRCDFTAPLVNPIGDIQRSINGDGNGQSVSVTLTANAYDPESVDDPTNPVPEGLIYTWACGNATNDVFTGSTVSCLYTTIGEKSPEVTVRNRCLLSTRRGLTVTVTQ